MAVDGGREFNGCREFLQDATAKLFASPVSGRFFRIEPTAHHGHISLRADVLLAGEAEEPGQHGLPVIIVLGNFSGDDPFEVQQAAARPPSVPMVEDQHLAMLQAKLSSAPPRLQGQVSSLETVRRYEDRTLQRQALDDIPVRVLDKFASEAIGTEAYELAFLRQVLRWFKHDFFSWTNCPRCEQCGSSDTQSIGMVAPTAVEKHFGAERVEAAQCKTCGGQTRFPRYNDPGKLLESRNGRCGEWANCFTLVCRALGYEARHVHDWTDHVWTEVYSDSLQRWVHADSCEAALDTPLVYEQGWGKKLTYCLAFARDHALDVTRRYTKKFDELLTRRNAFSEQQLERAMWALDEFALDRAAAELPAEVAARRHAALQHRRALELVELSGAVPARVEPTAEEQVGRTSGDAEWRAQRGELGATPAAREQAIERSERGLAAGPGEGTAGASAAAATASVAPATAAHFASGTAAAPTAAAAPAAPTAAGAKALLKARFAALVAGGLSPTEAAVRVLEEAKPPSGVGPAGLPADRT